MKNTIIFVTGILSATFIFTGAVGAQSTTESREELLQQRQEQQQQLEENRQQQRDELEQQLEENRQRIEEQKKQLIEDRCERVTERVKLRNEYYQTRKDIVEARHNNIVIAVQDLVDTLSDRYDTSELEESLTEFEGLILDFRTSTDGAIRELIEAGELACAENREQFNQNVETVNALISDSRNALQNIRLYAQDTLVPEIREIKQEVQSDLDEIDVENEEQF